MKHAIAQLEISLAAAENNAPISETEGNLEQAALERDSAVDYRAALNILRRGE